MYEIKHREDHGGDVKGTAGYREDDGGDVK